MKELLILFLFATGFCLGLKGQPNKDTIFLHQMNMLKSHLNLSGSQFNDFKMAHVKFRNKAGLLNVAGADTATIKQKFTMLKDEMRTALKAILTDEQYGKYKERVMQTFRTFNNDAAKNRIQVTTMEEYPGIE